MKLERRLNFWPGQGQICQIPGYSVSSKRGRRGGLLFSERLSSTRRFLVWRIDIVSCKEKGGRKSQGDEKMQKNLA